MEQNNEKNLTKYERKLAVKEQAAKAEKKKQTTTNAIVFGITAILVALLIAIPVINGRKGLKEYIKIGDTSISLLEFNYHKQNTIDTFLNSYSSILAYLGLDTSEPFETQVYDAELGLSWGDFFDEQTVLALRENKALLDEVKAQNLSYSVDEEFKTYMENVKTAAKNTNTRFKDYLVNLYGVSASEKNLEPIIKNDLTALKHFEYLNTSMAVTSDEAQAEYDANPDKYDSVDYRVLAFPATVAEGATEEEIATAMADAKKTAQEMLDKVNAGEDFETLCATYAPEADREKYADTETDTSLVTNATSTSYAGYIGWLFEDRKAGDTTLYTDEDYNTHYVLKFEKRYMGVTVLSDIMTQLTSTKVAEHVASLSEKQVLNDADGNLRYLKQKAKAEAEQAAAGNTEATE